VVPFTPKQLANQHVVKWNVDQLDNVANKTHKKEPHQSGNSNLLKLCREKQRQVEPLTTQKTAFSKFMVERSHTCTIRLAASGN
jgi:hypothetical protein